MSHDPSRRDAIGLAAGVAALGAALGVSGDAFATDEAGTLKFYRGQELLGSVPLPGKVSEALHAGSDVRCSLELGGGIEPVVTTYKGIVSPIQIGPVAH
jgi:hypothetical protein